MMIVLNDFCCSGDVMGAAGGTYHDLWLVSLLPCETNRPVDILLFAAVAHLLISSPLSSSEAADGGGFNKKQAAIPQTQEPLFQIGPHFHGRFTMAADPASTMSSAGQTPT